MSSVRTVLLIDDHALFRKGLAQLIELDSEFKVVGQAPDSSEGLRLAKELQPDIILIDLGLQRESGIDVLQQLRRNGCEARLIMLTVSDDQGDVISALRAGAQGYLLKDMEPEDLCTNLKKALSGGVVLAEGVVSSLAHALSEDTPPSSLVDARLTDREVQVVRYLSAGMCNKSIANQLGISEATVKVHVKHTLRKLRVNSRLEAAVWMHKRSIKA